jgi:dTDP-L-rhamnose 4-epimerase
MNILITGGAGFIGSKLANAIIERNHRVTVLDSLSKQIHGNSPKDTSPLFNSIRNKVNFILGSVENKHDWEKSIENQDIIVHLAAETGTGQSMYDIANYTNVNIQGTAIMLDLLVNTKTSVKKVVVASSRAIYGEGKYFSKELGAVYPSCRSEIDLNMGVFEPTIPGSTTLQLVATDEASKIHPSSVYGITKQVQEQLVMTVCPTVGISPVALRYQNVYGAGQSLSNPYTGILSIFSNRIRNGQSINIFEDGLESRDFIYIDDVVNATILSIEKEEANNQVFNVGTGVPVSVLDVVNTLVNCFNAQVPINISGNYRLGDIRHNYADISLINNLLGFEPKINFKSGCKKFVEWVLSQPINESMYEKSLEELKEKGLLK